VDVERVPLWIRHELRGGALTWRINRDHPAVIAMTPWASDTKDAERFLSLLEQSIPIQDIYIHLSNDLPVAAPETESEQDMEALARRLLEALHDLPEQATRLLTRLPITEPFNRDPEAARRIAERLRA